MKTIKSIIAMLLCLGFGGVSHAQLTYVDIDPTAGTGNTVPDNVFTTSQANDGLWDSRAFGNSSTIYQSTGTGGSDDCPELTTTITGLSPNTEYTVWVNFWSDPSLWSVRAGYVSGSTSLFARHTGLPNANLPGALHAWAASNFTYTANPLFTEGNRTLYSGNLGSTTSNGSGEIVVYLDDLPPSSVGSGLPQDVRAWLDGVSYAQGAVVPSIAASGSLVEFADVDVTASDDPTTASLDLTNDGDDLLVISAFVLGGSNAGDYSILTAPGTPAVVNPGSSVSLVVQFDPQVTEYSLGRSATLTVNSNVSPLVIDLIGSAVPVELGEFSLQ